MINYFLMHSACHLTRSQREVATSPYFPCTGTAPLLASLFPVYEMALSCLEPGSHRRKSTRGISRALGEG